MPTGTHEAGSEQEAEAFARLQSELPALWARVTEDRLAPRTVVVVPSLSLPQAELDKIRGVHHYEERLLCLLLLLRLPRTRVVYVTSQPIDPDIIDYYLHLLAGVPTGHARRRLTLISCHDASGRPLSQKLLERTRILDELRAAAGDPGQAHLACFNASELERTLATRLGIPLYAADPALADLGSKSGSREVFRAAGVAMPAGTERLRDVHDVAEALAQLRSTVPGLSRAVVKLNEGFSGEGNAIFSFDDAPERPRADWVRHELQSRLAFEACCERFSSFAAKLEDMGGVVEAFVEGSSKRSPSVQCRITPTGEAEVISTHDQVLGGPHGQIFLGCTFPAAEDYRRELGVLGQRVADELLARGALGRFSVDFVSVRDDEGWSHHAIEINLRKGGTTHPFLMLHHLTDGEYDVESGLYRIPSGEPRCYRATDNLENDAYRGLTPRDLIDISVCHGLHFHGATQEGVVFHLLGALSEYGKVGVVAIGATPARARALFERAETVLDEECGPSRPARAPAAPVGGASLP